MGLDSVDLLEVLAKVVACSVACAWVVLLVETRG